MSLLSTAKTAAKVYFPQIAAADYAKDQYQARNNDQPSAQLTFDSAKTNPYLDQGYSYEDIAGQTGYDINQVRQYADQTRPGYGQASQTDSPQTLAVNNTRNTGTNQTSAEFFDPNSVYESENIIRQANDILGRLGGQRQAGNDSISSTFGNYRTGLETQFGRNSADYKANRNSTIRENEIAKNNIDRKVAGRANSLTRYLGSRGGGDSQAGELLAPYAAAKTGTQLRAGVNQKFGANLQGLDQSFGRYKTDYDDSLVTLGDQERTSRNDLESKILNQEYSARNSLSRGNTALNFARTGDAASSRSMRDQAMPGLFAILQQIDALSKPAITPTVNNANYDAPELSQYTQEGVQDVAGVDAVQADSINPYYQYLFRNREEDNQFFPY